MLSTLARSAIAPLAAATLLPGALAETAAAAAPTTIATCDERTGQTLARNDRWRVFVPAQRGGGVELSRATGIMACARGPRPSRDVLALGPWGPSAVLAGDLVRLNISGAADSWSVLMDLATKRVAQAGSTQPQIPASLLLPGGAVVGGSPDPAPGTAGSTPGALALIDAGGRRELPAPFTGVIPFSGAWEGDRPGFYVLASDGQVRREVPQGQAPTEQLPQETSTSAAITPLRRIERVTRTRGVTTTYLGIYEVCARRARPGHRASLTVHFPNAETIGPEAEESDLVARLAPRSLSDLQLLPGIGLAGRFADRPNALRASIGKRTLPLTQPLAVDAYGTGAGADVVIRDAGTGTLIAHRQSDFRSSRRPIPIPADAKDFAIVSAPGSPTSGPGVQRWVLYTDAAGVVQHYAYAVPEGPR